MKKLWIPLIVFINIIFLFSLLTPAEALTPKELVDYEKNLVQMAIEAGEITSHPEIPPLIPPPKNQQICASCHPDAPPWKWGGCNTCHIKQSIYDPAIGKLSHQSVSINPGGAEVNIVPTIKVIKIEGDGIYFGSLNPLTRRVGTDVFWILVSSNDEYQKSISWTNLSGWDYDNVPASGPYVISKDRLKVKATKGDNIIDPFPNGGTTPVSNATPSEFERVDLFLNISWKDHAGSYVGTITIKVFQV